LSIDAVFCGEFGALWTPVFMVHWRCSHSGRWRGSTLRGCAAFRKMGIRPSLQYTTNLNPDVGLRDGSGWSEPYQSPAQH
jgi:hypothetical protein